MSDRTLVKNGIYDVVFEALGRDRLRRKIRVIAETESDAVSDGAEAYLSNKRLRAYSNELRNSAADLLDPVSIVSYEEWKTAAWSEANYRVALLGEEIELVSIETIREPVYEDATETAARSERAKKRALEARRRRNERSER